MSITAQYVVKEAQTALQDLTGVRWPASELVGYLNDGQRDLVLNRPDANATVASLVPVLGARQSLPAISMSLIDVERNTAGTKRAIRKVDMEILENVNRDWQSTTAATDFTNFMYDPREPNVFYLYPPSAASGGSVEIKYAAYPTDIGTPSGDGKAFSTVTGNITPNDQWANSLVNYVLSRAYAKDTEYGGNSQLAGAYYTIYTNSIATQLQASQSVAPKQ